jgi:8-oxo-dGTP pyrophosphatase MutT (NUDIX family)
LISRAHLIERLKAYATPFQEEVRFISRFLTLLESPQCYHRDHLPGHITGSAWITNEEKTHVLLVHHAKLNRWLQPGGHADGDEHVIQVALREAEEETGVKKFNLLTSGIFDLDIHPIPDRKDFPSHDHYDIRIAVTASMNDPVMVRWIGARR